MIRKVLLVQDTSQQCHIITFIFYIFIIFMDNETSLGLILIPLLYPKVYKDRD